MERSIAILLWQCVEKLAGHDAGIGHDSNCNVVILAERARVRIDVDDPGASEERSVTDSPLVQARAEREDAINLSEDLRCGIGRKPSDHAKVKTVAVEQTVREECRAQQRSSALREEFKRVS